MAKKLTQEQYIAQATATHGDLYDYSELVFTNTNTKVRVICSIHGVWMARPIDHRRGDGCPACKFNKIAGQKRHTVADFVEKARAIHGNEYDYSKVQYTNAVTKVEIVCKHHGSFFQTPDKHCSGTHCPRCSTKVSKVEQQISDLLVEAGVEFTTEKTFGDLRGATPNSVLRYDFWIPAMNLLLEYDGEHHTEPVRRSIADDVTQLQSRLSRMQHNDARKNKYAADHGIKLLRISYSQKMDLLTILINEGIIPTGRCQ